MGGLGVLSAVGPSAQLMMQLTASTAASSGSEDADGEELVEPPEPEATEPPSRRAAIRRLDGRRFSGAQAWPAPVAPCAHPFARRPRCWWRVNTQSASPTAHLSARLWTGKRWPDHTLGPHGAAACSRRACFATPSAAACWRSVGGKSSARSCTPAGDPGVDWGVLCACRGVAGDVTGPWRGRRHARITQRRHVGELEPELYFLGVGS